MTDKVDLINLEILRMAKELVTNEYIDYRAQLHNRWLTESDNALKSKGINLPYPDIPEYPNEQVIVKRAQILLDFLVANSEKVRTVNSEQPAVDSKSDKSESKFEELVGPKLPPITLADVKIPELTVCTGPTGISTATCTGSTGIIGPTGASEAIEVSRPRSKTRVPVPPDEEPNDSNKIAATTETSTNSKNSATGKTLKFDLPTVEEVLPYARFKVEQHAMEDYSSAASLAPGLVNALKQIKFN